jgi:hypothetical protein
VNGEPLDPQLIAEEVGEIRASVAPDLFAGFDPRAFPSTSLPALALAAAAYRKDLRTGDSMSLALRARLFEDGGDISDPDAGQERGVIGSPHFFTPDGSFFCPALDVRRDDDGRLRIAVDDVAFDAFLTACFT